MLCEPYAEEFEDENGEIVVDRPSRVLLVKWPLEGIEKLSVAAQALRVYADQLDQAERDGWQLAEPIDGGHGYAYQAQEDSAPDLVSETASHGEADMFPADNLGLGRRRT